VLAHQSPGDSPGTGNHRGDEHHLVDRHAFTDEWRGGSRPSTGRPARDPCDRRSRRPRCRCIPPGPAVSSSQGRSIVTTSCPRACQLRNDQMPVPGIGAGSVDQHVGGHRRVVTRRLRRTPTSRNRDRRAEDWERSKLSGS
jgi:hypothetical protein